MAQVAKPSRETATVAGRPSTYSDALVDDLLHRIACGESLRSICRDESMPDKATVLRWLAGDAELRARYETARQLQADVWRDEIRDLAKSEPARDPQSGRYDSGAVRHLANQVGTLRWLMAKYAPRTRATDGIVGSFGHPAPT